MYDFRKYRGTVYHIWGQVRQWPVGHDSNAMKEVPRGYYVEVARDSENMRTLERLVSLSPVDPRLGQWRHPTGGPTLEAAFKDVEQYQTGHLLVPFELMPGEFELVAGALQLATARDNHGVGHAGAMLAVICCEWMHDRKHPKEVM